MESNDNNNNNDSQEEKGLVFCPNLTKLNRDCPNYLLCESRAPKWVFDCHKGRCVNCNILFGSNLQFNHYDKLTECPICLEDKKIFVKYPSCTHDVCLSCFKRMFWGKDSDDNENRSSKCPLCRTEVIPYWKSKKQ
jgi:hypothetical protein